MTSQAAGAGGSSDNCWNSNQGTPQWIQLQLQEINIQRVEFQFQGGFVPSQIQVLLYSVEENEFKVQDIFYPLDNNDVQSFSTNVSISGQGKLRFHFPESTDFYGRIVCYSLGIYS